MILHGYFRSSATYRVRIALNLKGLPFDHAFHDLRKEEQLDPAYLKLNPQGLVPSLQDDGLVLGQSLAICEYLDERYPDPPFLPGDAAARARIRAFALAIACEIHPLQNRKILNRLQEMLGDEAAVLAWTRRVIDEGFEACAQLIADQKGPYCFGHSVTLADIFLIPMMANAKRYGARRDWPRFLEIEAACLALPAFQKAAPAQQPDAE